jgi:hypothetical protein
VRPVDQAAAMLVADPICWNVFPAKVLMAPAVRRRWMDGAADPPRNWICPARTVSFRHWCLLTARPAYRAVTLFLRDLAVNDMSSLTLRLCLRSVALVSSPLGIHVGRPPVEVRPRPAAGLPDRANQLSIRPPEVNARCPY